MLRLLMLCWWTVASHAVATAQDAVVVEHSIECSSQTKTSNLWHGMAWQQGQYGIVEKQQRRVGYHGMTRRGLTTSMHGKA
jgi:hypothetical protein